MPERRKKKQKVNSIWWRVRGRRPQSLGFEGSVLPAKDLLYHMRLTFPDCRAVRLRDVTTREYIAGDAELLPGTSVEVTLSDEPERPTVEQWVSRLSNLDGVFARPPTPPPAPAEATEQQPAQEAAGGEPAAPPASAPRADAPAGRGRQSDKGPPRAPKELICPVTGTLLVHAVSLPCRCQETVNADCALPGGTCPVEGCGQPLPERLVPDKRVRRMAREWQEKIRKYEQKMLEEQREREAAQAASRPPPTDSAGGLSGLDELLQGIGGADLDAILNPLLENPDQAATLLEALQGPGASAILSAISAQDVQPQQPQPQQQRRRAAQPAAQASPPAPPAAAPANWKAGGEQGGGLDSLRSALKRGGGDTGTGAKRHKGGFQLYNGR